MRVTEHLSLWDACRMSREKGIDLNNAVGPYKRPQQEASRDFGCHRYDDCLSVAANGAWSSFSCTGCRFSEELEPCTQGGKR